MEPICRQTPTLCRARARMSEACSDQMAVLTPQRAGVEVRSDDH
jgi:hypothetical protein